MADEDESLKKLKRIGMVGSVFTPGRPITKLSLFSAQGDRQDLLFRAIEVVRERGRHGVLYGEPGVGKTSLAEVLDEAYQKFGGEAIRSLRLNCSSGDSYSSLWHGVFRRLFREQLREEEASFTMSRVLEILETTDKRLLLIFDEFNLFEDEDGQRLMADTMKAISDHDVPVTLILIGVADSVTELLDNHQSIHRQLIQMKMERMSQRALRWIITSGLGRLQLTADPEAINEIIRVASGLPYYAHLLSKDACEHALKNDQVVMRVADVLSAEDESIRNADQSIRLEYDDAVKSPRSATKYPKVLLACALAGKDEWGYFRPRQVGKALRVILNRPVVKTDNFHKKLNDLTTQEHGSVLQKVGPRHKHQYRFRNPLLPPYIVIHGRRTGLIDDAALVEMLPPIDVQEELGF